MTTRLADGRRAPCVFGFEEEARLFLRLGTEDGWRVRAIGIGELVSVLSGPRREIELVDPDPLRQREAGAVNGLPCVDRERSVAFLLRKASVIRGGDAAASEAPPGGAVPVVAVGPVAFGRAGGVGETGRA